MATEQPRVAIVHDWLTNLGGAERVVLAMHEAFPDAPVYTSVYNRDRLPQFASLDVRTSWLQRWPLATTKHQLYPTLRQAAFESFDWSQFDVVITSSTAEAKGIVTPTEVTHISYIHTPTRYYWVNYEGYLAHPGFGMLNPMVRLMLPRRIAKLRRWDYAAAQRADVVLANSANVRARIKKYYDRDSKVLHPPVDIKRFTIDRAVPGDYYLVVSRLIPYKRIDLVVTAFNQLGRRLIVVGGGSEAKQLRRLAGDTISFTGAVDDTEVTKLLLGCRALIFPTDEDFGITPLEAMACGKPVIALERGGVTETVVEAKTGTFFNRQTPTSLSRAVERLDTMKLDPAVIHRRAEEFSEDQFVSRLRDIVARHIP